VAAARELFEEAGVLLVSRQNPVPASDGDGAMLAALERDRAELQEERTSFPDRMAERGLTIGLAELVYFSHWITPVPSPRRYDTRFFICELPAGQVATHCGVETVDGAWMTPARAIARHEAGEISLVSVTLEHLKRLDQFAASEAALAYARSKPIRTVNPRRDAGVWVNGAGAW